MAQSNKFRSLMSNIITAFPKKLMTPDLEAAFRAYATEDDALATKANSISPPSNTASEGSGSGGNGSGASASQKASAASKVATGKDPRAITSMSALSQQNPLKTPQTALTVGGMNQADREDSHSDGYPSVRIAMIAAGENVQPGDAITIINNLAYLARADTEGRQCDAIAVRGTGFPGEMIYTKGGTAIGRLAGDSGTRGRLVLSVTPGRLTFNTAEPGKLFYQEVGSFNEWAPPQLGDTSPSMFEFAFFPFPLPNF